MDRFLSAAFQRPATSRSGRWVRSQHAMPARVARSRAPAPRPGARGQGEDLGQLAAPRSTIYSSTNQRGRRGQGHPHMQRAARGLGSAPGAGDELSAPRPAPRGRARGLGSSDQGCAVLPVGYAPAAPKKEHGGRASVLSAPGPRPGAIQRGVSSQPAPEPAPGLRAGGRSFRGLAFWQGAILGDDSVAFSQPDPWAPWQGRASIRPPSVGMRADGLPVRRQAV